MACLCDRCTYLLALENKIVEKSEGLEVGSIKGANRGISETPITPSGVYQGLRAIQQSFFLVFAHLGVLAGLSLKRGIIGFLIEERYKDRIYSKLDRGLIYSFSIFY